MQSKATATLSPRAALPKVQPQNYVVYIFFAVVLAFFSITIGDKGFLSVMNLFNIARTTAMITVITVITVIAVAMTFVISAGELDLSVGSTAALAALTCGLVMQAGLPWPVAVIAALLSSLAVGCLNGFFVTGVGIPSFLVTLGMMQLIRGLDMRVTYTNPVAISNKTFNMLFGSGELRNREPDGQFAMRSVPGGRVSEGSARQGGSRERSALGSTGPLLSPVVHNCCKVQPLLAREGCQPSLQPVSSGEWT